MDLVKVFYIHKNTIENNMDYICQNISSQRLIKASKFAKNSDKILSLGSAYLLSKFACDYSYNKYGKPISKDIYFNISHSCDIVCIALSKRSEIGVDIEKESSMDESLIDFCLNQEEKQEMENKESFFSLFVSKESLAKAEGRGLSNDIKSIPAFPLDGEVEYLDNKYYRHFKKLNDYHLSVTLKNEDFSIQINELTIL